MYIGTYDEVSIHQSVLHKNQSSMASTSTTEANLATVKTVLTAAASFAATAVLVRSIARDLLPDEFQSYFSFGLRRFFTCFSSQMTIVIDEFDGLVNNHVYESAEIYLSGKTSPSTRRLKVSKLEKENNLVVAMDREEEVVDVFNGVKLKWALVCHQVETSSSFHNPRDLNSTLRSEVRSFELCFHKKYRDMIIGQYLPFVIKEAKTMKQEKKTLKIFTVDYQNMYCNLADAWAPVNLDHPATFDTLALDSELKNTILKDLERFVNRKEYYKKVGKAWKRGYLLYGPPGTGKSSLIAAMANYLNFDIYDLELTEVRCNSDLRRLLIATANRSILVVEDIDCTIELQDRMAEARAANPHCVPEQQVTLSGLLNFIDGLWSSCGDERIIIFTTNYKHKLDPALLRPGRMDVHIHMSYCTPCGFRLLASNYIGIDAHPLFSKIEEVILLTEVTPAEVAEQLMRNDDVEEVLNQLIEFLKTTKIEKEEVEAKKIEKEEAEAKKKQEEKKSDKDDDEKKINN